MENSMIKKATNKNLINYEVLNLFDYADLPHRNIDDYPFGGGDCMIFKPEPIFRAYDDILKNISNKKSLRVVFPTPDGRQFNHKDAIDLSQADDLIFMCGHYKGIDQRIRDEIITDEHGTVNHEETLQLREERISKHK